RRDSDGGQNADDRNDDHQFDQGEALLDFLHGVSLEVRCHTTCVRGYLCNGCATPGFVPFHGAQRRPFPATVIFPFSSIACHVNWVTPGERLRPVLTCVPAALAAQALSPHKVTQLVTDCGARAAKRRGRPGGASAGCR